jgi:hypothetical protein
VASQQKEAPVRNTALAFAAIAVLAMTAMSVMKSTPTGAQAPDAAVSVLEMMTQTTDLPIAPAPDAI